MAARDYKKLYNELNEKYKSAVEIHKAVVERYDRLNASHKHVNEEFTKAVNSNKRYQEMLYEQRGIIGFLESKIEKLKGEVNG
jgi:predicted nuclease with TOPRIM domain